MTDPPSDPPADPPADQLADQLTDRPSDQLAMLLLDCLSARLAPPDLAWLQSRLAMHRDKASARDLHISLGLVPRKLGRADLALEAAEQAEARRRGNGRWHLDEWTVETAARVLILLAEAERDAAAFGQTFSELCRTADLGESLTYYRAIAMLPYSEALDRQVAEGLRTNMRAVFEAIAHANVYAHERFDTDRWNHLVLKALFVDSPLWPIVGLDERANPELAEVLSHYAHERWAAGRAVSPELWRCVGPFARGALIDDLKRVAESDDLTERRAGVLALADSPDPTARELLARYPDELAAIEAGQLSWDRLYQTAAPRSSASTVSTSTDTPTSSSP